MLDVCGPGGSPRLRLGTHCPCAAVFIYFLKLHGFFASGNPPHSLVIEPGPQEIVHFSLKGMDVLINDHIRKKGLMGKEQEIWEWETFVSVSERSV